MTVERDAVLPASAAAVPAWCSTTTRRMVRVTLCLVLCILLSACYAWRSSHGGGQTSFEPPRTVTPTDIALPPGYRIETVATGLTYPTGITFDDDGRAFVVEAGYAYGEDWTMPRLLRIEPDGRLAPVASGDRNGPWTGAVFHDGAIFVTEGGTMEGGRILRITPEGDIDPLLNALPSRGDHHTNAPAVGPDGALYFAIGVATNAGIVGPDNAQLGWLPRHPDFTEIPCRDVTLTGENFEAADPIGERGTVATGAYVPFGTETRPGQVVEGRVPCTGAIFRMPPGGSAPELVAWGLRNPFGLAFAPDGRLYATDNSYDIRGSRPVFGTGDLLWAITGDTWYGFPDFHGQRRLDNGRFAAPGEDAPPMLLARHPNTPPAPIAVFPVHASANGLDFSRSDAFGYSGEAFVAEFGDMTPNTGKVLAPVGYKVVRIDPETGVIEDFAVNAGDRNGPASALGSGGLERPVAVRFNPAGDALYIVDFGVMTIGDAGPEPRPETGVVWRISRGGS